jgi:alkanesulfonate monooxygenase SsuD/methylene tetrahydromethanopterin reductase-like flavin-dependent oxidoreductase (luciferase family)
VATTTVRLGPWVTNAITRHPSVTASAICSLDELADGRAFLGIGNGDDSVLTINKRRRRLDGLGADVELVRALARGEQVERDGRTWTLASARPAAPPVYWAANGPRSLSYGGRYADGVINSGWTLPAAMRDALEIIHAGARSAGRDPAEIVPIFNSAVAIDDDGARARATVRSYVARGLIYPTSVDVPGWSEAQRLRLLDAYDYYSHLSPEHSAGDLVPDELLTCKAVAGTASEVVAQMQAIADAGYEKIALLPMGDVESVIERLATEVVPQLRPPTGAARILEPDPGGAR